MAYVKRLREGADAVRSARIIAERGGPVTPAEAAELSAALIALRARLPPVPRCWTDTTAARVEIGARLSALAARVEIGARLSALAEGELRDWIKASMFRALEAAEDGDDVARDALEIAPGAEKGALMGEWAKEMGLAAAGLLAALFPDADDDDDNDPREWAGRFIEWLERRKEPAEREADDLRELLAQEEIPGVDRLLMVLVYPEDVLARMTWAWTVRAWWLEEREAERRRLPGLPLALWEDNLVFAWRPGASVGVHNGGAMLVDRAGQTVAPIADWTGVAGVPFAALDALDRWTHEGAAALGSVTGTRLLLYIIGESHLRAGRGEVDARVLAARGWGEVCEWVGISATGKNRALVRGVLLLGMQLLFRLPDASTGNLWSARFAEGKGKGGGGREALVEVTVGTALLPHFSEKLPQGRKRIVPLLSAKVYPDRLPPRVGRERDHAAQVGLALDVLMELTKQTAELVTHGGASLPSEWWRERAEWRRLPLVTLPQLLNRWTRDGDDGAAFLTREGDHWTLADAHADALDFLTSGAERVENGRDDGQKSAKKRSGK